MLLSLSLFWFTLMAMCSHTKAGQFWSFLPPSLLPTVPFSCFRFTLPEPLSVELMCLGWYIVISAAKHFLFHQYNCKFTQYMRRDMKCKDFLIILMSTQPPAWSNKEPIISYITNKLISSYITYSQCLERHNYLQ